MAIPKTVEVGFSGIKLKTKDQLVTDDIEVRPAPISEMGPILWEASKSTGSNNKSVWFHVEYTQPPGWIKTATTKNLGEGAEGSFARPKVILTQDNNEFKLTGNTYKYRNNVLAETSETTTMFKLGTVYLNANDITNEDIEVYYSEDDPDHIPKVKINTTYSLGISKPEGTMGSGGFLREEDAGTRHRAITFDGVPRAETIMKAEDKSVSTEEFKRLLITAENDQAEGYVPEENMKASRTVRLYKSGANVTAKVYNGGIDTGVSVSQTIDSAKITFATGDINRGSATANINNVHSIATLNANNLSGTAGTDYFQIKATATGSAGSYKPTYSVQSAGYISSGGSGESQTLQVDSDTTGKSLYIPKAAFTYRDKQTTSNYTSLAYNKEIKIAAGYCPGATIVNTVGGGSAATPATTITANPSLSTVYDSTNKGYKMSVSASQSVTPSVSPGYISSGTAGTITVSGSAYVSQSTIGTATTATHTATATVGYGQEVAINAGYHHQTRYIKNGVSGGTLNSPSFSSTSSGSESLSVQITAKSRVQTAGYLATNAQSGAATLTMASGIFNRRVTTTLTQGSGNNLSTIAKTVYDIPTSWVDTSWVGGTDNYYPAGAGDMLVNRTAWVNGAQIKGEMPYQGAVTPSALNAGGSYTIPAGYHNGTGKVTVKALDVMTDMNNALIPMGDKPQNATQNQILAGYGAYANTKTPIVGAIQTYTGSTSITPSSTTQSIAVGGKYCASNIKVLGFVMPVRTKRFSVYCNQDETVIGYTNELGQVTAQYIDVGDTLVFDVKVKGDGPATFTLYTYSQQIVAQSVNRSSYIIGQLVQNTPSWNVYIISSTDFQDTTYLNII